MCRPFSRNVGYAKGLPRVEVGLRGNILSVRVILRDLDDHVMLGARQLHGMDDRLAAAQQLDGFGGGGEFLGDFLRPSSRGPFRLS